MSANPLWPLKNSYPLFPDKPGSFASERRHDIHTGVDLYCELGQEIVAVEDGEVFKIENFTGPNADDPSPWWNDTQALLIKGKSGVVVYGEISTDLSVGQKVSRGDIVGRVTTSVLKKFKGRPMCMLHFELMDASTTGTVWWRTGESKSSVLKDPTPFLMEAAASGYEVFNLDRYQGNRFLNLPRFPKARTLQEALYYYKNRAIQLLKFGWSWDGAWKEYDWGVQVELRSPEGESFYSVYVLEPGQGHLTKWFEDNPDKSFVTSSDCKEMVQWLNAKNYPHRVIDTWYSDEYRAIERFYGERKARRSGLHMMNHIEEGIFILQSIGASQDAINAFCLHPILQADEDLVKVDKQEWNSWGARAIALAMEYRHTANAHLPKNGVDILPKLSVLDEVNQMLIADKIQNCKDFQLHMEGRPDVPNSERLSKYFFHEWFKALGVRQVDYVKFLTQISDRTGRTFEVLLDETRNETTLHPIF